MKVCLRTGSLISIDRQSTTIDPLTADTLAGPLAKSNLIGYNPRDTGVRELDKHSSLGIYTKSSLAKWDTGRSTGYQIESGFKELITSHELKDKADKI